MSATPFRFKKFSVSQENAAHPVGTDGVLLGTWADASGAGRILDIGTGTGLIALMLAQRTPDHARITAIDLNADSVSCAAHNFSHSPWPEKLRATTISVQQFAEEAGQTFDLIVSNPPFFSELTLSPDSARSAARHTAGLSIGELLESVLKLLEQDGKCCIILPEKEGKRLCEMAVPLGLFCTLETQVRSRAGKPVERLLLQLERDPGRFRRTSLEIYETGSVYTEAFRTLTQDFYL